jgi:hypothetical protein
LFHKVPRAAAARFAGAGQENSAAYAILYRSFDHGHMRRACEDLQAATLNSKTRNLLRKNAVSQHTRDFAGNFPPLQGLRQTADYDPNAQFHPSDVASLVDSAEAAMEVFDLIPPDEQADVLALLMVRSRS